MHLHLRVAALFIISLFCAIETVQASIEDIGGPQGEYERSIEAVVRNKRFYKAGHFDAGIFAGTLPYDSVISHYSAGGRLTWHITDHFGWEILDGHYLLPSVTNFTRNTVRDFKIKRLDAVELKTMLSSNFVVSPLYGKIRFFGSAVVYFDIYLSAGLGAAQTRTLSFNWDDPNQQVVENVAKSSWDPMFNFGLGVKVFASRAFGISVDLRDYVIASDRYGSRSLSSNFAIQAGLTFFLPTY